MLFSLRRDVLGSIPLLLTSVSVSSDQKPAITVTVSDQLKEQLHQKLRVVVAAPGTQPTLSTVGSGSRPTLVAAVPGSRPTLVAAVPGSRPTLVATVPGSRPTLVAAVPGSRPTLVAAVPGSRPTLVAATGPRPTLVAPTSAVPDPAPAAAQLSGAQARPLLLHTRPGAAQIVLQTPTQPSPANSAVSPAAQAMQRRGLSLSVRATSIAGMYSASFTSCTVATSIAGMYMYSASFTSCSVATSSFVF